ncbi:MAG: TetR family transcriptional regulator [Nitrospira sp.]|nr:MAG: TetR family transcriptional regulator [Nitrospira sp.]
MTGALPLERSSQLDMIKTPALADIPLSRVARRKERTKRQLLEVARRLFSEKGIYWATVEDITELADLGKGTFYKYFDSKETIIRVLLEEGLDELLLKTDHAVRNVSSHSKILGAVIGARADFFLTYPDYLLLFHQVRGLMQLQGETAKDLREVYDAHLRRLAQLIRPSMGPGMVVSARDVATAIAAYTSGLLTYHVLFEGQEAVRRKRDHFVEVLERSLRALLKTGNEFRSEARSKRS